MFVDELMVQTRTGGRYIVTLMTTVQTNITSVHTGYAGADSSFSWRSASQSPPRGSGSKILKCGNIGVGARQMAVVSLQPDSQGSNLYKAGDESIVTNNP